MPYVPVNDQRAQIIMQSLQGAQQNTQMLGQWLSNFMDQQAQLRDGAKAMDYMVKADPTILDDAGMVREQWDNMGSREKISLGKGVMQSRTLRQAQQEQQAKLKQQRALTDYYRTQSDTMRQAQARADEEDQALPLLAQMLSPEARAQVIGPDASSIGAMGALKVFGQAPVTSTQPTNISPEQMLSAIARVNKINPRAGGVIMDKVLERVMQQGATTGGAEPQVKTINGVDVVYVPKTGAFQLSPFSKAQAEAENRKQAEGVIEIADPNDPLYGPRIRIPLSQAQREYPHLLKGLQPKDGQKAGTNAPAKTTTTGASSGAAGMVLMRDKAGVLVRAPAERVQELLGKGYRLNEP